MRKTWSTINYILNKSRKKKSFPEAFKEDGQTISDKIEIANKFNLYFTNIDLNLSRKIKTPDNKNFSDYLKTKYNNVFTFKEVTTGEVENIIDNLNRHQETVLLHSFSWWGGEGLKPYTFSGTHLFFSLKYSLQ